MLTWIYNTWNDMVAVFSTVSQFLNTSIYLGESLGTFTVGEVMFGTGIFILLGVMITKWIISWIT